MRDQFFGKPFWIVLAALAAVFGIAILVFGTPFVGAALAVAAVTVFVLSVKRLEWGLVAAFAELFANSHGHLFSVSVGGFPVSLRMAVFGAVMAAWAVQLVRRRVPPPWRDERLRWFAPLAAAIAVGFAVGFLQNDAGNAFRDGNGFLYLAYVLPVLSVSWTPDRQRLLLQTFAAAAAWVCLLTLGLLYVFTHVPRMFLSDVYAFVRDTRTGELTDMGGVFRIFLQAQLSVVVAALFAAMVPFLGPLKRAWPRWLAVAAALWGVVIISLSRSFWLALAVAAPVLLVLAWKYLQVGVHRTAATVGWHILAAAGGVLLLAGVILVPIPPRTTDVSSLTNLLSERTTESDDVAVSSRWNLLSPMMEEIRSSPVVGSGFGEEVTFQTDDPRARAVNPDGTWTTYAFEWGWLDLWLKMGVLGPLAFLYLLWRFGRALKPMWEGELAWLGIAMAGALVMLYVTHVFSPYLNHPLGLGLIVFFLPFLPERPPTVAVEAEKVKKPVPAATPALAMDAE